MDCKVDKLLNCNFLISSNCIHRIVSCLIYLYELFICFVYFYSPFIAVVTTVRCRTRCMRNAVLHAPLSSRPVAFGSVSLNDFVQGALLRGKCNTDWLTVTLANRPQALCYSVSQSVNQSTKLPAARHGKANGDDVLICQSQNKSQSHLLLFGP